MISSYLKQAQLSANPTLISTELEKLELHLTNTILPDVRWE